MRYKGKVYRPPSEAYSLIVQVTYGCSHNGCAFCDMYDDKHFAIRPMEEVREDFEMARRVYKKVERVFLADGDALMRKTEELSQILGLIYGLFPECQRVTCYASPTSLQIKSEEDLRLLRSQGLTMVYMGLESGCDEVLYRMNKGHTAAAIVGFGVIDSEGGRHRMVQYGAITTPAGMPLAARLVQIGGDLEQLIRQFQPDEMSIEELFFSKNITTGIAVAHGRGVLLYTAEKLHLPVYEYTPMQIKQAVVGYGLAEKRQVMDMTRRLLKLKAVPRPDDAADALAIAICHARSATSLLRRKDPDVKETV